MILVGRLARRPEPDEPDDVRRGISKGMEAVGDDADGAGRVTEDQFCAGDRQVQEKNPKQDARYRLVAVR
jgi:hypothetical protein